VRQWDRARASGERERERETGRQTDRQTDRQTHRQAYGQTERALPSSRASERGRRKERLRETSEREADAVANIVVLCFAVSVGQLQEDTLSRCKCTQSVNQACPCTHPAPLQPCQSLAKEPKGDRTTIMDTCRGQTIKATCLGQPRM